MVFSKGNQAQQVTHNTVEDAAEPSMDDILASIRQIIADDDTPDDGRSARERYTHPTAPSNTNTASIEKSTPDRALSNVGSSLQQTPPPRLGRLKTEELAESFRTEHETKTSSTPLPDGPPSFFNSNPAEVGNESPSDTFADQVTAKILTEKAAEIEMNLEELMRPAVRKWLGDNLPTLVERLIREEIESVSRGRAAS